MGDAVLNRFDFERAVFASDLPMPDKMVLLALMHAADWPGGKTSAKHSKSLTDLAVLTSAHRVTVARTLNRLELAGWVKRKRPTKERAQSMKECTQYRLTCPVRTSSPEPLVTSSPQLPVEAPTSSSPQPELVAQGYRASSPGLHKPDLFQTFPDQAARAISEKTGATPEEAEAIKKRIRTEKQPRNLMALIWKMATDGDLAAMLSEYRDIKRKERIAAELKALRRKPMCVHGEQGGAERHPATGQPLCPLCRRNLVQTA